MSYADISAMVQARAEIDESLNKVLALVAPANGAPVENADAAWSFVRARVSKARAALARFEDAVKGGA